MLDDDFMEWMKELPIGFMQYLYEVYQLNQFAEQHGVSSDNVGMSIQGDNFRMVFINNVEPKQPKRKQVRPITDQDITRITNSFKSNGIDETLDK